MNREMRISRGGCVECAQAGLGPSRRWSSMKTYREGERFPGRIGRTFEDSGPRSPCRRRRRTARRTCCTSMIDDIGFGWIEPFGGLIRTPNIPRLAENGLRYTNFTTTALCSPTRSCLLTGRNHHSVGMANIPELARDFRATTAGSRRTRRGSRRCCTSTGTPASAWASGTTRRRRRRGSRGRTTAGRPARCSGSTASTGSSAATRDQWYPKLFLDREAIDQPRLPEEGYHLSEDLVERAISWIAQHRSLAPDKPWLAYLAFGAMHAPHHIWPSGPTGTRASSTWAGTRTASRPWPGRRSSASCPSTRELSPMLEGMQAWDELLGGRDGACSPAWPRSTPATWSTPTPRSAASSTPSRRPASSTTRCCSCSSATTARPAKGTLNGVFNEQSVTIFSGEPPETVEQNLARIDQLGQPGSYNHYPVGWALAGNTPFKLCKQYTHFGGARNPLVVHWPDGIAAKGELRHSTTTSPTSCRRSSKRSASRRRGSSTPCSRSRSRASR